MSVTVSEWPIEASGRRADHRVLRHLAHEPVQAAPPSRAYRLRKFVRKHRGTAIRAVDSPVNDGSADAATPGEVVRPTLRPVRPSQPVLEELRRHPIAGELVFGRRHLVPVAVLDEAIHCPGILSGDILTLCIAPSAAELHGQSAEPLLIGKCKRNGWDWMHGRHTPLHALAKPSGTDVRFARDVGPLFARPLPQLRKLLLDFHSDSAVPLSLFRSRLHAERARESRESRLFSLTAHQNDA